MDSFDRPELVTITYHHEDGSWWADSPDLPGMFAGGDTLDEAKQLAHQVVSDECGDDVVVAEWMPVPEALQPVVTRGEQPVGDSHLEGWADEEFRCEFDSPVFQATC